MRAHGSLYSLQPPPIGPVRADIHHNPPERAHESRYSLQLLLMGPTRADIHYKKGLGDGKRCQSVSNIDPHALGREVAHRGTRSDTRFRPTVPSDQSYQRPVETRSRENQIATASDISTTCRENIWVTRREFIMSPLLKVSQWARYGDGRRYPHRPNGDLLAGGRGVRACASFTVPLVDRPAVGDASTWIRGAA